MEPLEDRRLLSAVVLYQNNLDTDPGWSRQGEWAFGTPTGGGGTKTGYPDPTGGYTGSSVLGVKIDGDYKTNPGGPYYLTTGPIVTTGYQSTQLGFHRWLNTDAAQKVTATVDVSNNGSTWHNLYTNPATTPVTDSAWQPVQYDIGAYADDQPAVYVRWGYAVVAGGAAAYSGWNIDDVSISGTAMASGIRGTKWEDLNGNGVWDAGEPGLAGVTIYLDLNENGQLDPGEPSTLTAADDPATIDVDETGTYAFPGLAEGRYLVAEVVPDGFEATYPATGVGGTGELTYVSSLREGAGGGIDGLDGAFAVASSPDGSHLYVAGQTDNALAVFGRNAATGQLTPIQTLRDGQEGVGGLRGVRSVVVSPDGQHVYAGGHGDWTISVFSRDATTGELAFVEVLKDGVNGVDGLMQVTALAVSTEGAHLYASASADNSITTFSRDAATGRLTWIETLKDGTGAIDGLYGASSVAVSSDDAHVYVTGYWDDALVAFSRDSATGQLTFLEVHKDGVSGVAGLHNAQDVQVSPDGKHVYAVSFTGSALVTFSRDAVTGELAFIDEIRYDEPDGLGLGHAYAVTLSADSEFLYTASWDRGFVNAYSRDAATGLLSRLEGHTVVAGVELDGLRDVFVTPDGNHLYAVDERLDSLFAFQRDSTSGLLTATGRIEDGTGGVRGLDGVRGVASSPDGAHVYAVSSDDGLLGVFSRDISTGTLTQIQVLQDNTGGVDGLQQASAIAISPDGNHVYVTAEVDRSVAIFQRDPLAGTLTYLGRLRDGYDGVNALYYANSIAISPDGTSVYVTAYYENALNVFRRDPISGSLELVEVFRDDTGGVDGLLYPEFVTVDPGGTHVYALSRYEDAVTVWTRDTLTGRLTFSQLIQNGTGGIDTLRDPTSIVFSPDGADAYVAANYQHAILRFSRDAAGGQLSYVGILQDGVGGVDGLQYVSSLIMSPTGSHLYSMASHDRGYYINDRAVASFARDPETGALTFLQVFHDDVDEVQDLHGALDGALSPDGRHLYVASRFEDALVLFERDAGPLQPLAHTVLVSQDQWVENVNFGNRDLPPEVVSIGLNDPNPTSLANVNFTVTFREAVTGVDASDFALTTSGTIDGATVTDVAGSGATYTVTVATGFGNGTLRLDVVDDDTIVDDAGQPLGGVGPGNGSFTDGQIYLITRGGSAEIHGRKWNDLDGDGIWDQPGEPALEGVTVYLDLNENGGFDAGEPQTATDAGGAYSFVGLPAGSYVVREVVPDGWRQTSPAVQTFVASDGTESNSQVELEGMTVSTTLSSAPVYLPADEWVDGEITIDTDVSSGLIGLSQFRADLRFAGIDGSGLATVILDTGVDLNHPFFGPDADSNGVADRIVYHYDFADIDADATDVNGHGSNVTSIIASQSATYTGMAPGVDIISLKVFTDGGSGNFGYVEQALQWVVANAAAYNIVSVNMSLGDGGNYSTPQTLYGIDDELAALANMGVIVVSSSGNSFYSKGSTIGVAYPSADPNSLSIGAVYDASAGGFSYSSGAIAYSSGADRLAPFSQRHPDLTTVFAPGAPITGAGATGGTVTYHGTSQASPHIAGIAVLAQDLAERYLGRRLTPQEFSTLLKDTAATIHDGDDEDDNVVNTGLDFPRVDVLALAEAIWLMQVPAGSHLVELEDGQIVTGIDFGNQILPGQVAGTVWNDADGDGIRDAEEVGLEGIYVYADLNLSGAADSGEPYAVTGADGSYLLVELAPGDYTIRRTLPFGWANTYPASAGHTVTVVTQQTAEEIDFGNRDITGEVRGSAWIDLDGDAERDAGEPALVALVVFADLDANGRLDPGEPRTLTGTDGSYVLERLLPQTHTIAAVVPEGWQQTVPALGAYQVTVVTQQAVEGIDFANRALPGEVRGVVWRDVDGDGIRDSGESGLAGVTVYLDLNYNGQYDAGEPTAETRSDDAGTPGVDETGTYAFPGLEPGTYAVGQMVPVGGNQTYPDSVQGRVEQVSVTHDGVQPNSTSLISEISDDGRYVIFQSGADNLVPGYSLGMHYYVRDLVAGTTEMLTVTPGGLAGQPHGFNTYRVDITPGGRFAVFATDAADLVDEPDTNARADVFLRDRELGITERISLAWNGSQSNDSSLGPAISDDGRYVVFQSFATNLVPNDNNGQEDVFLYDRQLRQLRLISAGLDGNPANGYSRFPDISGDGRYVAFHSNATNLVAEDTSSDVNVFLYDTQTGTLEIASRHSDGSKGAGWDPKLSTDGRFMAFESASVYDPGDDNGKTDIFIRDRQTGAVYWASRAYDGAAPNDWTLRSRISADGHYVTFVADASNLVVGDTNGVRDIFLYYLDTATISRVSLSSAGNQLSARSDSPSVSLDGRYVSFDNYGPDVVAGDTNGYGDVFTHTRDTKAQHLVAVARGATAENVDFGDLIVPPEVVSVIRAGVDPTNASSVDYTVTFTEAVTGVDVTDFLLAASGTIAEASVTAVAGSATTYTVTVSTGTGDGTLRLDLADDDTIVDTDGLPLGWIGVGNGDFNTGEAYTIDRTAPQAVSILRAGANPTASSSVDFTVTFTESVTGVDATDFVLATTGGIAGASIASIAGSADAYTVTVDTGTGTGTIGLNLVDDDSILDGVGNPLDSGFTGEVYEILGPATISGVKWNDLNGDGVRDAEEPGLAGWTIYLDQNRNRVLDAGEPSTTTAADGSYEFTGLQEGTYYLAEVLQTDWEPTYPNALLAQDTRFFVSGGFSGSSDGEIVRFDWDGSNPTTIKTQVYQSLGVDDIRGQLYYYQDAATTGTASGIFRSDLDGSNAEFYYNVLGRAFGFDHRDNKLFYSWSRYVYAADLDNPVPVQLIPGLNTVVDIEYDPISDVVFAANANSLSTGDNIYAVPADGSTSTRILQGPSDIRALAVDTANRRLYFTERGQGIYVADLDGANMRILLDPGNLHYQSLRDIEVVPELNSIFWLDTVYAGIYRADLNGAGMEQVVDLWTALGDPWIPEQLEVLVPWYSVQVAAGQVVAGMDFGNRLVEFDFGDAPSSAQSGFTSSYPTTLAENGARHLAVGPKLGGNRDAETDGTHSAAADADDLTGTVDDEDGVVFSGGPYYVSSISDVTYTLEVDLQNPDPVSNRLDAWIDFDRDGNWRDAGEQIFTSYDLGTVAGVQTLTFTIPRDTGSNVVTGETFARFRISTAGNLSTYGAASDGEVEDHRLTLEPAGEILGTKWHDLDADGLRDAEEPGLAGWTIYLDLNGNGLLDPGENSTTTDAGGNYRFDGLPPGSYTVSEILPSGWEQTYPGLISTRTERVSLSSAGVQADDDSYVPVMSADGRFVAFHSRAATLVPGDTNGFMDVFVFDRQSGAIERVSVGSSGIEGNGDSFAASISADGRYVAFHSEASNLVPDDTNGRRDVFVYDRDSGTIARVSVSTAGIEGDDHSDNPSISADGRYVAFQSSASNLVAGDSPLTTDVFVRDLAGGTTEIVSAVAGVPLGGYSAAISGDGQFVAFASAHAYVAEDTNGIVDLYVFDRAGSTFERVSVGTGNAEANGTSSDPSISADGRYVAFSSMATNLVEGDVNGAEDIFVRDRQAGTTQRVNVSSNGVPATYGRRSYHPSIGGSGRFVTFVSEADSLVPNDGNGAAPDVFVHDLQTGATQKVNVAGDGSAAGGWANWPSLSADGRFVAFQSTGANLVSGDTNNLQDIFVNSVLPWAAGVHEVTLSVQEIAQQVDFGNRVAPLPPGNLLGIKWEDRNGNGLRDPDEPGLAGWQVYLDLNHNGQWDDGEPTVVTQSDNGNTPGVDETGLYAFYDLQPGEYSVAEVRQDLWVQTFPVPGTPQPIERVSVTSSGAQADNHSYSPSISADGRFIAFHSAATNLVSGDTNSGSDVFVYDRDTNTVELVSVDSNENQPSGNSYNPVLSADGRFVAFYSSAPLVTGDTGRWDVFVRDRLNGTTQRVSADPSGGQANGDSRNPIISPDGRFVAFYSDASNLVANDTNTLTDAFLYDRQTGLTERISVDSAGNQAVGGESIPTDIAPDGRYVLFHSLATNLVSGDTNGRYDTFLRDRQTGTTERLSVDAGGVQGDKDSYSWSMTPDARLVVFHSQATNLVPGGTTGQQVFLRDRVAGTVEMVSVNSLGQQGTSSSWVPQITPDGRYVMFASHASNLVPNDTNNSRDVFVRDLQTGVTQRISVDGAQGQVTGDSYLFDMTPDGRYVAFQSSAAGLVTGDTNGRTDIFVAPVAGIADGTHFTYVASGANTQSVDFGNRHAPGDVTGTVWIDPDANGVYDAAELPAVGWTVFIDADGDGVFDDGETSATTAADGTYTLADVPYGTVDVRLVLPAGDWEQTLPAGGIARTVAIVPAGVVSGVDFAGRQTTGTVTGLVWLDRNADGQNPYFDERPAVGWTVFADANSNGVLDTGEISAITASNGTYALAALPLGSTDIRVQLPDSDWEQTFPDGDAPRTVTVPSGGTVSNVNFGVRHKIGQVAGLVWLDWNGNGLRDAGEPPAADWVVYADMDGDGVYDQTEDPNTNEPATTTGSDGTYLLGSVETGSAAIRIVLPGPDWQQTLPAGGASQTVLVTDGGLTPDIDFAGRPSPSAVAGTVFHDLDGNGARDTGEPGLEGWTVYWDGNENGVYDPGAFGQLEPDDYAEGTLLNTLHPDVTLSNPSGGNYPNQEIRVRSGAGSTGTKVIGNYYGSVWTTLLKLRADFDAPAATVSIDAVANVDRAQGTLAAYNAAGTLLATYTTANLYVDSSLFPRWETMTITRPAADIAYVVVNAAVGSVMLDHLTFGHPSADVATVTDADGNYLLSGLSDGDLLIGQVPQPGWLQTWPGGSGFHTVSVAGNVVPAVDFGNRGPQPGIYGTVFSDSSSNRLFDLGEPGLAGWTVFLDADADGQLDEGELSTTTDPYGAYGFPDLGAGTYTVAVLVQPEWVQTAPIDGSHTVTVTGSELLLNVDFGMALPRVYVDADAAPGGNGVSWETAYNSLDIGIDAAADRVNLSIAGLQQVEIWIAEGTYKPVRRQSATVPRSATFTMQANTSLVGGFAGTETSADQRLRDNAGLLVHETILSGDLGVADVLTDNAYTVVYAYYQANLVLDGLTITAGYADIVNTGQTGSGGGVFLDHGSTTINDVTFVNNYCVYYGAALRVVVATVSIDNSRFFDNHAFLKSGSVPHGGAINLGSSNTTYIRNSVFEGNTADLRSGAIEIYNTTTIIEDSVFRGNRSGVSGGGATFNAVRAATYRRVSFVGNSSTGDGGAVLIGSNADASFLDCSFLANSATNGGGIYDNSGANNPITQSRFIGNQASQLGGAVYGYETFVHFSTLTQNHAQTGGGIYASSAVWINSSIIAGNTIEAAGSGPDLIGFLDAGSGPMLIGNSSGWAEAGSYIGQGGNIIGTAEAPVDPLFIQAPFDGGDGWGDDPATPGVDESANDNYGNLHPQLASPAVNAGSTSAWPAPLADLDGHPRIVYGTIDMGAYEYRNRAPTANAGGPYGVVAGGTVTLDGFASLDPDEPFDTIVSYAWDLDGDGLFDDATGATPVFSAIGLAGGTTVSIALQVTDTEGAVHSDSATVFIVLPSIQIDATGGNDLIVVTPGSVAAGLDHVVRINEINYSYSPFYYEISIDGLGGTDTILINGTGEDETATLIPGSVEVVGQTYRVVGTRVESVTVNAGAGNDVVAMSGSAGSNRLYSYAGYSLLTDSARTFSYRVEGFDEVAVNAPGSTSNYAFLYDSPQDDTFQADPTRVILNRAIGAPDATTTTATGFQRVYAYATGGSDHAALTGSAATTNRFYGYADYSIFTESSSSFYFYAGGFETVTASSPGTALAYAYLYDSPGYDTLAADPASATMDRAAPWSDVTVSGFKRLYAYSTRGGDDSAQLTGSSGGNTYRGYPAYSTLTDTAGSFYHYASGFRSVTAIGSSTDPSSDRAYLYDSAGDDTFSKAFYEGGKYQGGSLADAAGTYENWIKYFDLVYARSSDSGTNDTIDVGNEDELAYNLILYGTW